MRVLASPTVTSQKRRLYRFPSNNPSNLKPRSKKRREGNRKRLLRCCKSLNRNVFLHHQHFLLHQHQFLLSIQILIGEHHVRMISSQFQKRTLKHPILPNHRGSLALEVAKSWIIAYPQKWRRRSKPMKSTSAYQRLSKHQLFSKKAQVRPLGSWNRSWSSQRERLPSRKKGKFSKSVLNDTLSRLSSYPPLFAMKYTLRMRGTHLSYGVTANFLSCKTTWGTRIKELSFHSYHQRKI